MTPNQLDAVREFARATRRGANIQTAISNRIAGLIVEMVSTSDPLQRETLGMCIAALSRESYSVIEHARANGKTGLEAAKAETEAAAMIESVVSEAEAEAAESQHKSRQTASKTRDRVRATIDAVKALEASYVRIYDGREHTPLRKAVKRHCKAAIDDLQAMERRGTHLAVDATEWIAEVLQPNLDAVIAEHVDGVTE